MSSSERHVAEGPQVVVVGAGTTGLAAAAALRRVGVPALVLDRAQAIGASWRSRYDRLRLNTSRFTSTLPASRFTRGTPLFPSRDDLVRYLERYAEENELEIELGTRVEKIDRRDGGWLVRTADGERPARQVVVATGYDHTPSIPDWPGRDRFRGRLLHAAEYRNAESFEGSDVLVVGPGCSGVEIAYDLAENGAGRVRLAVRTSPYVLLRAQGGMPNDLPAQLMIRLPTALADAQMRLMGRLAIGDLSKYGLGRPAVGPMARLKGEGKAPAIVDREMVEAIKRGRIEIVAGVRSVGETEVELDDGTRVEPETIVAATGYRRGLEPLVGHLGVLDERGLPRIHRGEAVAPGLRFVGYEVRPGQIRIAGVEGKRAAREIARELRNGTGAMAPLRGDSR